jgi:hypothetical protein
MATDIRCLHIQVPHLSDCTVLTHKITVGLYADVETPNFRSPSFYSVSQRIVRFAELVFIYVCTVFPEVPG